MIDDLGRPGGGQAARSDRAAIAPGFQSSLHRRAAATRPPGADDALPPVLSRDEVERFLKAVSDLQFQTVFVTILWDRTARVRSGCAHEQRYRQRAHGHNRSGKGPQGSPSNGSVLRAYCECAGPEHFLFPGTDPARPVTVRSLRRACRVAADVVRAEDAAHRDRVATTSIPRGAKTIEKSVPALDFSSSRYSVISLQSTEVAVSKNDSKSVACEIRTKSAKSGGLETNRPRERISGLDRGAEVRRFSCEGPWLLGFCARLKAGGESWTRIAWRRERTCQQTLSAW